MDDLTYTLRQLCQRNRDGSHTTQADRMRSLSLAARQLREAGFRQMKASSLKGKHVQALLERWQGEGLSSGTIKNRLSHLRWWAEKIGKAGILPADNTQLGVAERRYVTNISKARELGTDLEQVIDAYVHMSLQLQAAFGLRRKESLLFQPHYADRGDHLALKGSWTKGGRERTVPITTVEQREVLQAAHGLAGSGSLIPAHKNYIQQRHVYDGQCKRARLSSMHGLRHQYAQSRYETLTGWPAPTAGGPSVPELSPTQRIEDRRARQAISRELGHERVQITAIYLGN
ncbi:MULTISPECIES: phage integrase N-terminal domain-containing protein [Pseudomonas]|uniref:phage integrase N-terminal domain-containing protein n=1 Tax=Pseudomonas TaxID=286 RepID=UPI001F2CC0A1|nr:MULTISPECIES: phage integrase N-terminal domain-containing protein [Pseudomonas]UJW23384.1 integrase domain-containing protein [Pseudomonas juntendi]